MKIIFNHNINNWYWQIYEEWARNHEVILPEHYDDKNIKTHISNFTVLETLIKENPNIDFIFDFNNYLPDLIRWERRRIDIPIVIFVTNLVGRPYSAKMSIFANLWYVNANAESLIRNYKVNNLIYEGMAANPNIFYPVKSEKKYDISFFGRFYGDRSYWLNIIKDFCSKNDIRYYFPLGHGENLPWSFEDINKLYNQSKINLSFAQRELIKGKIKRRVNLRTFEICMSGNFQLMQYTPCIEEYFEIGEEIVCWKNKKELFEKILYYLENEDEREKIAKKGYQRAIQNHTWSERLERIGKFLKKKEKDFNISKFIVNIENLLNKNDIKKFNKSKYNKSSKKFLEFTLKKLDYKTKRDIRKKKIIKVNLKNSVMIYKQTLKNFYFIRLNGKILMVIKRISHNSKINLNDWYKLEEVLYLTENYDLSLPQFGLLTNGVEWIIRDFKNRRWLKNIPTRRNLKSFFNSKNHIIRLFYYFKNNYKRLKFDKLFRLRSIEKIFRLFFLRLKNFFLQNY